MFKSVSKKTRRDAATHKLVMCEERIASWERWPVYDGVKPSSIADQLVWLHKWHPELRERVSKAIDRMSKLYEDGAFNCFEPWQM